MILRMVGAVIILVSCGGFGFYLAAEHKREERCLRSLAKAIDLMICELEYRQPPLPQLIEIVSLEIQGPVAQFFGALAHRLQTHMDADASVCTGEVLKDFTALPLRTRLVLQQLGIGLGRFSLSGQVSCLQGVAQLCARDLRSLAQDRDVKLRSYRTLGLCAGTALIILFI